MAHSLFTSICTKCGLDYALASSADINLWTYGRVQLHEYTPAFVLRTRRVNKSRLYVNVCMCAAVPVNPKSIILTRSKARLALDNRGAVDTIRHNLTYEQARAAEQAQRDGATRQKKQRAEAEKKNEQKVLRELHQQQQQRLLESNSDDEVSEDSELEDDFDPVPREEM
jgi:hypothetical protein